MARERTTFPLVPRRRLTGLPFGDLPARRRGHGTEVIASRAYEPGDPVSTIDWFASARLSAAVAADRFVVRDRAADEAPRVALVVDRRPAMALYPPPFPWLSKPRVLREAAAAVVASAVAARADLAALDFEGDEPRWLPPARRGRPATIAQRLADEAPFTATERNVELALAHLAQHRRDLPAGTFVFVLSDLLAPPPAESWLAAAARGWDVVPVVIQDPVWEQSFPDIAGAAVPLTDPRTGEVAVVRLSRRGAAERRAENQSRVRRLLAQLESYGLRAVVLGTSDPFEIDRTFLEWAERRRRGRWGR